MRQAVTQETGGLSIVKDQTSPAEEKMKALFLSPIFRLESDGKKELNVPTTKDLIQE